MWVFQIGSHVNRSAKVQDNKISQAISNRETETITVFVYL